MDKRTHDLLENYMLMYMEDSARNKVIDVYTDGRELLNRIIAQADW